MKYLLCALLISGAFFFDVSSQENSPPLVCEPGETPLQNVGGCGKPAPEQSCKMTGMNGRDYSQNVIYWGGEVSGYVSALSARNTVTESGFPSCASTDTRTYTTDFNFNCSDSNGSTTVNVPYTVTQTRVQNIASSNPCRHTEYTTTNTVNYLMTVTIEWSDEVQCPTTHPLGPISYDDGELIGNYCYRIPEDEPEPPEECGTTPLNPCPPPPCVPGGGGLMVCKDDPDAKCWLDELSNVKCEEGCGWINDEFFCTVAGNDNPSFEKCKFTFNGYACPSEPKDDITEPEKPVDQMTKQDVKDTNIGIESRQDVTNELLQTQLAAWERESDETQKGLADLNSNLGGKLNTANGHLSDISGTLTEIGDFLKPAGEIDPPPPEPESYYESEYEDGIKGIWDEHSAALMAAPMFEFMNQFKFTPSGTQPDWNMCFNLGSLGNYGCERLEVPAFIWAFIKVCILITAAFYCRSIVIGK